MFLCMACPLGDGFIFTVDAGGDQIGKLVSALSYLEAGSTYTVLMVEFVPWTELLYR